MREIPVGPARLLVRKTAPFFSPPLYTVADLPYNDDHITDMDCKITPILDILQTHRKRHISRPRRQDGRRAQLAKLRLGPDFVERRRWLNGERNREAEPRHPSGTDMQGTDVQKVLGT